MDGGDAGGRAGGGAGGGFYRAVDMGGVGAGGVDRGAHAVQRLHFAEHAVHRESFSHWDTYVICVVGAGGQSVVDAGEAGGVFAGGVDGDIVVDVGIGGGAVVGIDAVFRAEFDRAVPGVGGDAVVAGVSGDVAIVGGTEHGLSFVDCAELFFRGGSAAGGGDSGAGVFDTGINVVGADICDVCDRVVFGGVVSQAVGGA